MIEKLVLYYRPSCPFCRKVLDYLNREEIKLAMRDTSIDSEAREELIALTGKTQVPCLVIDGSPMHESNDIIIWLSENL